MNKIVFVGLVAFALTAVFVSGDEFYDSGASSNSSNSFTEESSSSSSIPPIPIPSSAFPSESSSGSCQDGTYYSEKEHKCLPCAAPLSCLTCSNGHSCDSCDNNHNLKDGACVIKCALKYGEGCETCSEKRCTLCKAQACCTKMKWFFNATASTCVDPALMFGPGCLETDGTACTKCTAQTCCGSNQFFNYLGDTCVDCTTKFGDKCSKCSYGACTKCSGDTIVSSTGECKTCAALFGEGCSQCNATACTTLKEGFFLLGTKVLSCAATFGEKCTACNKNGCTTCSDNYKVIGGFCKTCSSVYGEHCSDCDSEKCTSCLAESFTYLVNGVCVPCDLAFGSGCATCDVSAKCKTKKSGYFISHNFAFTCDVITNEEAKAECKAATKREKVSYRNYARGEDVSAEYKGVSYTVTCNKMVDNCADCNTDGCTACNPEYTLYGGSCKQCSALHGAHCTACNVQTCTTCEAGFNIGADGKCVKCEGETPFFDATTKTCRSCVDLFPNCKECGSANECSACEDGYFVGDDKQCHSCTAAHGAGCTKCTKTECSVCTSDECCGNEKIIVKGGQAKCGGCTEFDAKCSQCSEVGCTECATPNILTDGQCKECKDIFDLCGECDADHCKACTDAKYTLTDNGCFEPIDEPSSGPGPASQPSSAGIKPTSSKKEDEGGLGGGAIAGIIIGVLLVLALAGVGIYCFVTAGRKHGKIDPVIYEEDPEFISMSVL